MPTITIEITGSNPTDNSLELDNNNHPHHRVKPGVFVTWTIKNGSVDAITSIKEKSGSDPVWSTLPTPNARKTVWTGKIRDDAAVGDVYAYSITWTKGGTPHVYDPIISIKPHAFLFDVAILLPLIGGIILGGLGSWGVTSFKNSLKKRSER